MGYHGSVLCFRILFVENSTCNVRGQDTMEVYLCFRLLFVENSTCNVRGQDTMEVYLCFRLLFVENSTCNVRGQDTMEVYCVSGYCLYKNHTYQHAEQWQDGCTYNCVCENAATGSWRCVDR